RDLIVKSEDGAAVRLGDLGTVVDGVQDTRTASWFNGRRAIVLAVQRQPGTNTVRVADAVHAMVDRLRPQLPGSVRIETLNDRSVSIRRSVRDVQITLMITLLLVII